MDKDEVLLNLELLKKELKNKKEPTHEGPPEVITIGHDDYHAEHVGRTEQGHQFFLTNPFIAQSDDGPRREFLALFVFDDDGNLTESLIEEMDASDMGYEQFDQLQQRLLSELGNVEFQDIYVKPFAVEHNELMMGLIPNKDEGQWTVQLLPGNFMAFREPWDLGEYNS